MTDTPGAAAVPAGWYADSTVPGQLRWWSGAEWTEHVSAPSIGAAPNNGAAPNIGAAPYTGAVPMRPALPSDRPIYSVFIWLIVLMPLLSYAAIFAWQPNFDYLSSGAISSGAYLTAMFTPGYFAVIFAGWIIYGLSAVFAWRDVVWLRAQGVVRPFPWPWVFLSSLAYVIGRSVIVHRVAAPRGRVPIWVMIAVLVVGFIVAIAWTVTLMSGIMAHLPTYSGQYTG
ncbi:MAG: DUF2510 domain-containing protein [Pseudolysinimonas sp.]